MACCSMAFQNRSERLLRKKEDYGTHYGRLGGVDFARSNYVHNILGLLTSRIVRKLRLFVFSRIYVQRANSFLFSERKEGKEFITRELFLA